MSERTAHAMTSAPTETIQVGALSVRFLVEAADSNGSGDAICIRRGVVHGFDNNRTEDAKFLAISTPGVMTPDYFREIRDVLASAGGGPPDVAKLAEVMRRRGLTPAPPAS
jgi:hypothetical protein